MTLTPETPVHWGVAGDQQGPAPARDVVAQIQAGALPPNTPLWWQGAAGWMPADQVPGLLGPPPEAQPAPPPPPPPQAAAGGPGSPGGPGGHATDALMAGLSDQELDDEFIALLDRSWAMYKETEKATTIDEVIVGGIVTALVDCGFVLIDLTSGSPPVGAASGTAGAASSAAAAPAVGATASPAGSAHSLRFEVPTTGARVTVELQHLTADVATANVIGHRANLVVGYGERLAKASEIAQALRGEVTSAFVASPEPGTVTFDADITSGYVFAQIDLYLEPERYVGDDLTIDHDLLRRHIASLVHTMRTFVHARFGN